jgi:hypothetical protein
MQAINLKSKVHRPDFLGLDKKGQIILIAEVKGKATISITLAKDLNIY